MKEIKISSGEYNKLIRIVENYKAYVKDDEKLTDEYKNMELENADLVYRRIMGQVPVERIDLNKNDDLSVFGFKEY